MDKYINTEMENELEKEKLIFEEPEFELIRFCGSDIVTASGDIDLPVIDDPDDIGGDIDTPILDDEEGGGGTEEGGGGGGTEEGGTEEGGGGGGSDIEAPEY